MSYEMLTRTGRSFWEVTSAMQNAIRKGDYEVAGYALWELLPQYTSYLRKRLLVISAEDCFGIITKEILQLCALGTAESLTKAVSLLCLAKKNRDADYFVCNLMSCNAPTDLDKYELGKMLTRAIRKKDVIEAGRISAELFQKNRKALWSALHTLADCYYPYLIDEFNALNESNERVSKPAEETIFVAKAIVLIWTVKDDMGDILGYPGMEFCSTLPYEEIPIIKQPDECHRLGSKDLFPEWAYNWHTTYGKYKLRRDAVHAIENDQHLLTPLETNLFDDCSWNVDLNACLQKHNPRKRPIPYDDGKIDPAVKYGKQE